MRWFCCSAENLGSLDSQDSADDGMESRSISKPELRGTVLIFN